MSGNISQGKLALAAALFNDSDYKRFKWAFLKYICEVNRPVTDYELFLTSNFAGYMDDGNQMKEYILKNKENCNV